MYKVDLSFQVLPKSLNRTLAAHWGRRYKTNNAWDNIVWSQVHDRLPDAPLERARIKIVRHFWRTLDYDGLVGSMKPMVDGLVTAGVLSSDSWKVLGVWDVTQEFRPKKDGPLLTVEIFEV